MPQKTDTIDKSTVSKPEGKKDTSDVIENTISESSDEIPSWSELAESMGAKGAKKATIGYLIGGATIFATSIFALPFTIGFPFAVLTLGFLSGLIGKSNYLGAGIAGLIGGVGGAIFTGGLTAIFTIAPIIGGGVAGLLAGMFGVFIGSYIKNKIR